MGYTILVADDDPMLGEHITDPLEYYGYQVTTAADGLKALEIALHRAPDLIILDLMLPEMDGLEVCRRLRQARKTAITPIIMISAREDEIDKVVSLEVGADAYLTKPLAHRELLARIHALLQRADSFFTAESLPGSSASRMLPPVRDELVTGPLHIDLAGRRVTCWGKDVDLPYREFELLIYFVRHPERILFRDQLLQDVWGEDSVVTRRTVDRYVYRLRQKLERNPNIPQLIQTVQGGGYCFMPGQEP